MTNLIYPQLSYTVQGVFFEIYNQFRGLGLSEEAWEKALVIELTERKIEAIPQVEYELYYKVQRLSYRLLSG